MAFMWVKIWSSSPIASSSATSEGVRLLAFLLSSNSSIRNCSSSVNLKRLCWLTCSSLMLPMRDEGLVEMGLTIFTTGNCRLLCLILLMICFMQLLSNFLLVVKIPQEIA